MSRAWTSGAGRWVPLSVSLVALCACGVPNDAAPRALPADEVPLQLGSQAPVEQPGDSTVRLFFQKGDDVEPVQREVTSRPSNEQAVQLLFEGPVASEQAAGYSSQLSQGEQVQLEGVRVDGTVAVVTLSGDAVDKLLTATDYAQIVATLSPTRVSGVRFRFDGRDLPVPDGAGNATTDARDQSDYAGIVKPPDATPRPVPSARPSPSTVEPSTVEPSTVEPSTVEPSRVR